MNSKRRLQRNKLRQEVGNKNLRFVWKNAKANVLLEERAQVLKARKKAIKKNTPDKRVLGLRRLEIDRQLRELGYDFQKKRIFV